MQQRTRIVSDTSMTRTLKHIGEQQDVHLKTTSRSRAMLSLLHVVASFRFISVAIPGGTWRAPCARNSPCALNSHRGDGFLAVLFFSRVPGKHEPSGLT